MSGPLLVRALRRVESRSSIAVDVASTLMGWTDDNSESSLLRALSERPASRSSLHLIDLLEDELLRMWRSAESSADRVLQTVGRLRVVRATVERRVQQLPGAPLVGRDGLEFLTEFVHDMRSPLSALQLLADRVQQGCSGPLTPLQQRQLRLIYAAAHALNIVTSNALQMTREWDQLEEPEARPFSVTRLLSEVQDMVGVLAVQKGLELTLIRPNVDRRLGHPVELRRILLNLVTNGLKFTRTGGITVSARDQVGDGVEFAVEDTGPGIDAAAQATLFQPFRRSEEGRATFSATGLGLAISQRLVRALGGELKFSTGAGRGTRFNFLLTLPVS